MIPGQIGLRPQVPPPTPPVAPGAPPRPAGSEIRLEMPTTPQLQMPTAADLEPIQQGAMPTAADLEKIPPKVRSLVDEIGEGLYEFWKKQPVHPVDMVRGAATLLSTDPRTTGKAMYDEQAKMWDRAKERARAGDFEGMKFELAMAFTPFMGPQISDWRKESEDEIKAGDFHVGKFLGGAAGLGAQVALPEAAKILPPVVTRPLIGPHANPVVREAVRWGAGVNIPVDLATTTGNPAIRGAQYLSDRSLGGAWFSGRAEQETADALTREGRTLAQRAHPAGVATNITAGEAVREGVEQSRRAYGQAEGAGYDTLRKIEETPAMTQNVSIKIPVTGKDGQTVMQRVTIPMQMPVNLKAAKAMLKPIYDRMLLTMPLAQEQANAGMKALKNILDAPDYLPLSLVDQNLSAIKKLARESEGMSHGLSAQAVRSLEGEVQIAVAKGGRPAQLALAKGRQAHIQGVKAKDLAEALRIEPQQIFANLTQGKDAWLYRLRDVAREAPAALPKIGRAFLDQLMDKATAGGGFKRAIGINRDWQALGAETKKLLFPDPRHRADLDHFFTLVEALAENPNPSGTGHLASLFTQGQIALHEPLTGAYLAIGGAALSKMLHSPAAVKALTEGLSLGVGAKTATKLSLFSAISREYQKALEATGASPGLAPAAAGAIR